MATLAGIQKQIAKLEKQAELILKAAATEAAKKARELIEQHKLTAADVGLAPKAGKAANVKKAVAKAAPVTAKPAGVPKYRDPKSGKTWTGTGKPPGWIAGAKNRAKFLIDAPAEVAVVAVAPVVAVPVPTKVAKQVVAAAKKVEPKVAVKKTAAEPKPAVLVKKAVARKSAAKKAAAPVAAVPTSTAVEAAAPLVLEAAN